MRYIGGDSLIKKTPLESWILKKIDYRGTPELGRKAIYHYQLKKLRAIIAFVKSKSIFYKNHLAHISEQQIDSFEDFAKVPFTTEEDIRVNPLHFICESQGNMSRVVSLNTSGTTGNPKRIYFTEEDQGLTIDFFNIGMSTLVKQGDKVLILMPGEQPGTVGDLLKKGLKRMNIEAFIHGPVYDVEKTIEVMIRNNINCLVGIPVQVLELCRYKEKNVSLNIDNVLLSTDYVSDAIIKELKTHWGCRVFCHYGMTEMGLGGGVQCEAFSGYHMREADLYFEIINPYTGMVVPEGEWGEVVFTTLTRKGMPLIRYRTGDISRFIPQSCPCNTVLKSMDKIQGRLEGITRIGNDKLLSIPEIDEEIFKVEGVTDYHLVINKNGEVDCLCFEIKSNEQQDEKYFEDFKTKIIHVLNNIPVIREGKLENKLEISVDLWKNVQASNGTSKRQIEDKRGER